MKSAELLERIKTKTFSYVSPKIVVKESKIHGKGVFAKEPIKKDEIICVSGGMIITRKERNQLFKKWGRIIKDYTVKIADDLFLFSSLSKDDLEIDDLINHSCNPNAGIKGQIFTVAMRDIKPGEEITYDYAMTDSDPDDYFECHCNAKNCRKVITGNDWKNPILQKKYKGYFSLYLEEKIKKLNHHKNKT